MAENFKIKQSVRGYRFSMDPFLLADNITALRAQKVLDMGAGNGILPLLLHKLFPEARFWGIDIQREPLIHARENCACIKNPPLFIQSDIRYAESFIKAGSFDVAVSNPPYRKAGSGRINPADAKAVARHELALTFAELVKAANHALADGGLFCIVHLAERSAEVIHTLIQNRFAPINIRFVHGKPGRDAYLIIVNSIKNGRNPVRVRTPVTVFSSNGEFSAEIKAIYKRFNV
ncbi:MAG: SAM-dependent methyltransferase [bacterium]|nr:MAG: SAM-dependent methyltransferase [bacterium]